MVLPFTLQMATRYWHGLHGTAKTQLYTMWTMNIILFHVKQGKRVWPEVEIAFLLCVIGFFLVCILSQCHDYPNVGFFCIFPKQAGTRSNWIWRLCVCSVRECELGSEFGHGYGVKPVVLQPMPLHSVYTARACSSPEWCRRHKTVLF